MATITTTLLPLFFDRGFSYTVNVQGTSVELSFYWNSRSKHYHFSVKLRDGTIVVEENKLCVGTFISTAAMAKYGFTGSFFLARISPSVEDNETTRYNMVDNFVFCYSY